MLTAFYYGILSGIGLQAKPSLAGFPCSVGLLQHPLPPATLTLGCAKVGIPSKRKLGWAGRYPWLCGKEQPSPQDDRRETQGGAGWAEIFPERCPKPEF